MIFEQSCNNIKDHINCMFTSSLLYDCYLQTDMNNIWNNIVIMVFICYYDFQYVNIGT